MPLAMGFAPSIVLSVKRPVCECVLPFGSQVFSAIFGTSQGSPVAKLLQQLWNDEHGQDIAEYAVMLAVILVIVVGTIRLIGSNANNVFSQVGSAIQ